MWSMKKSSQKHPNNNIANQIVSTNQNLGTTWYNWILNTLQTVKNRSVFIQECLSDKTSLRFVYKNDDKLTYIIFSLYHVDISYF